MRLLILLFLAFFLVIKADTCQGLNCGNNPCCPGPRGTDNASICCSADEACCPDPIKGGVCCVEEASFCCAPDGVNPSRCCPRWMVCCQNGRYGCCSPDEAGIQTGIGSSSTAYALFDESGWDGSSNLYGFTIDTDSAEKSQIEIPQFVDYGEMPRVFVFDPTKNVFYLLRANFTDSGFNGTAQIFLTTADPVGGASSQIPVTGAAGLVTGFQFVRKLQALVFATYAWNNNQKIGYNFYMLDPTVGKAIQISTSRFVSGKDNWDGWFTETSDDGKTLYRIGYQDVVNSIDPGLGITDISTPKCTTTWVDNFTQPQTLGFYTTIDLLPDGSFLSMSADDLGQLNVIQWSPSMPAKVLASLGDAHYPMFFGPIATAMNRARTQYFALVVHDGWIPIQTDRWALASVDLIGGSSAVNTISPWMVAGTDSVCGFGIAD